MQRIRVIKALLRIIAMVAISWLAALTASAQTVRYIHTDGLGSSVLTTDKDRNIVNRSEYEPYGSPLTLPLTDGPGYTGHVMDAATQLTYMQQRYYDSMLGRFLSADPVGSLRGGHFFNRYKYGANNPFKFVDHDGRAPTSEILYGDGGRTGGNISGSEEIKNNLINDGSRKFAVGTELARVKAALSVVDKVREKVESTGNPNPDSSARYFMKVFQPVSTRFGVELSANIINKVLQGDVSLNGQWYLSNISVGTRFDRSTGIGFMAPSEGAFTNIHTHPLENTNYREWHHPFSSGDVATYKWQNSTGYLSTPSMRLFKSEAGGAVEEVK